MPSKSGSSPYAKNNDGNKEIEKIISKEGLKNNHLSKGNQYQFLARYRYTLTKIHLKTRGNYFSK